MSTKQTDTFDENFKRIKELAIEVRNEELLERLNVLEEKVFHNFSFAYQKQIKDYQQWAIVNDRKLRQYK
jgi:hypothetical protein